MGVILKRLPGPVELAANGSRAPADLGGRLVALGFVLAVVAVVLQTTGHLLNAFVLDYGVWNLDAGQDGNALSWASSAATFGAALGAFLLGIAAATPVWRLVLLAGALAFMSVDDVVAIHEKLAFANYGVDIPNVIRRGFWPLLYLPLFAFVGLTLWQISARMQERIRRSIQLGLGLLAFALVAEVVATLWWSDDDTSDRVLMGDLEVAAEEGAELAAWILIATGLLAILCVSLLSFRPRPELSPMAESEKLSP